jgi:hypothetical protein
MSTKQNSVLPTHDIFSGWGVLESNHTLFDDYTTFNTNAQSRSSIKNSMKQKERRNKQTNTEKMSKGQVTRFHHREKK